MKGVVIDRERSGEEGMQEGVRGKEEEGGGGGEEDKNVGDCNDIQSSLPLPLGLVNLRQ